MYAVGSEYAHAEARKSPVVDGKVLRNAEVRLLRDNVVIHTGKVGSLRRFKDDTAEVKQGYECGIGIEGYNDVKIGDIVQSYKILKKSRSLADARTSSSSSSSSSGEEK